MNVLVPPTSESGVARAHGAAAGPLIDADLPIHQDGLLQAMLWICRHHGEERSAESLLAGLPRGSRLKPSVALRAMEEHGFSAGVVERHPAALSTYLFPVVLLMKEGGAVIVLRRTEASRRSLIGRSSREDGRQYEIVVPETGKGVTTISEEVLLEDYSGHAMLIKPRPAADARSGEPLPEAPTRWLFGTLWRYRSYYYSTVLAAILINVLTLAGTFFTMNVYDRVVPNQAYTTLWSMAIGVVIAMTFEFIARHIRSHLLDQAGKKADLMLGAMLFRQALAIRLEHRPASAGSFAHQLREFESVRDFITSATLATLTDLPFVFLFIGVVYMIAGPLAWVPALAVPLVVGVSLLIQWPLSRVMRENLRESSMKQGILIEAVEGIESLKASGSEGFMQKRWEDCSAMTAHTALKSRELSTTAMNFVQLVQQLETVVIMVWGVYLIGAGQLAQGALFGAVMLASRAVAPLGQVVGLAARFQQAKAALESLNRLMKMPTERDKRRVYLASPQISGGIQAREVSFAYPAPPMTPNPQVLTKVDVDIQAGERVAILGRIGSGKSTLLRVMAGLYQPIAGQVLADGVDISQIDPGDWRSSIGFVGQDVRLFYGSLRENVMMSRQSATTEQFLQVARMTGLDRLAAAHPLGFDLQVGEMGQALSGGQRQLVGLARCLLARPRVLLMDEPTSAMDGQTESMFMQQLVASLQGRTFVLVTHRLALLELVERVIVIDSGRVVLDGPKAQVLAALGGVPNATNT